MLTVPIEIEPPNGIPSKWEEDVMRAMYNAQKDHGIKITVNLWRLEDPTSIVTDDVMVTGIRYIGQTKYTCRQLIDEVTLRAAAGNPVVWTIELIVRKLNEDTGPDLPTWPKGNPQWPQSAANKKGRYIL